MFTKTVRPLVALTIALFVMFAVMAMFSLPTQAAAAPSSVANTVDNSCLICHDDLYYNHDIGKSFCLTDHTDRCTNCHEGNDFTMKKEDAHLGLVLHPQERDGAMCQECHTAQEIQTGLFDFEAQAGFDTVIVEAPYVPAKPAELGFPETEQKNIVAEKGIWLVGGVVAFGFWVVLFLFSPKKP